jgi:hypothetical protein
MACDKRLSTGHRPTHDACFAEPGSRVAPASADPRERQPQLFRELPDLVLPVVNQIAARLGVLLLDERIANRPHSSADPVACVGDGNLGPVADQVAGRHQAGQPRADDKDLDAVQGSAHCCSTR